MVIVVETFVEIMAWMINYVRHEKVDVITYPCHNLGY